MPKEKSSQVSLVIVASDEGETSLLSQASAKASSLISSLASQYFSSGTQASQPHQPTEDPERRLEMSEVPRVVVASSKATEEEVTSCINFANDLETKFTPSTEANPLGTSVSGADHVRRVLEMASSPGFPVYIVDPTKAKIRDPSQYAILTKDPGISVHHLTDVEYAGVDAEWQSNKWAPSKKPGSSAFASLFSVEPPNQQGGGGQDQ